MGAIGWRYQVEQKGQQFVGWTNPIEWIDIKGTHFKIREHNEPVLLTYQVLPSIE